MSSAASRPNGVTIIAVIHCLLGGLALFIGLAAIGSNESLKLSLAQGNAQEAAQMGTFIVGFGAFLIVLGIGLVALGVGMFQLKRWGLIGTIVLQGLSIVADFAAIAMGSSINPLRLSLAGIMIGYLAQPAVRERFQ